MRGERGGKRLGVATDEKRAGDAREQRRERFDAAFLGDPAGDPHQPVIAADGAGRGVGVGRLAVVDEGDPADRGDALLAVRQSGKAAQATRDLAARHPEHAGDRGSGGGILRIVRAGQRGRILHRQDHAVGVAQHAPVAPHVSRLMARDGEHPRRPAAQPVCHRARVVVIDTHQRKIVRGLPIEDQTFRRDVSRHVAVAIQMIHAEIEHRRDIEAECGESLQHVGGHLEDVGPAVRQQSERQ